MLLTADTEARHSKDKRKLEMWNPKMKKQESKKSSFSDLIFVGEYGPDNPLQTTSRIGRQRF